MKVIITGGTGMVGKGVLYECLKHNDVQKILLISRSSVNINHPKLQEVLLQDFAKIDTLSHKMKGYDACFHCMGISSAGKTEEAYSKITYHYTKLLVDSFFQENPKGIFNYISGSGTKSSEKGNSMWSRIKGKTENYILNKGFKDAYMFRPGAIIPENGIKSRTGWYNTFYILLRPFFPLLKKSKNVTTTTKIGLAMIQSVLHPQPLKHLENRDINALVDIETI